MISTLAHYPVDLQYGTGAYRRRLHFVGASTGFTAQVDDTHHSYWLTIDTDGAHISGIDAGFNRAPTMMCPGSVTGLQSLLGLALHRPIADMLAQLPRTSNCSHLVDLAIWAVSQLNVSTIWEIEIPDQIKDPVWIKIQRDGQLGSVEIHRELMTAAAR
jgi:hypothetical protein